MAQNTTILDVINLGFFALIGIIIKLFLGGSITTSGESGPATAAVWGYGVCALAVLGIMIVTFGLTTQMTNAAKYNTLGFVFALFGHSIPALLTIGILSWLIAINMTYYKQINKGKVADEYNAYSIASTVMTIIQVIALFSYTRYELKIDQTTGIMLKEITDALSSRLASVIYLLTIGNVIFIGIMTIILKYFSTDG